VSLEREGLFSPSPFFFREVDVRILHHNILSHEKKSGEKRKIFPGICGTRKTISRRIARRNSNVVVVVVV